MTTALIAASCGSSDTAAAKNVSEPAASSEGTDTSAGGTSNASFPTTEVLNLGTGSTVNFNELVGGGDTPVLLWFYFPH